MKKHITIVLLIFFFCTIVLILPLRLCAQNNWAIGQFAHFDNNWKSGDKINALVSGDDMEIPYEFEKRMEKCL